MYILGISAFYHDSAACLLIEGQIIAAAQEERFSRKKHDSDFPQHAINYCLKEAKIDAAQIENFIFYEKPVMNIYYIFKNVTSKSLNYPVTHEL